MWKLNILTPKRHILGTKRSTKRRAVTIHPAARLVGEPKKTKKERKEERHPKHWQTGYSPRPPTSSDQNQTLHGGWPAVFSYTCPMWSKSVKGLRRCGGRKWPFHITLASGLYNSSYYRTSHENTRTQKYIQKHNKTSQQHWGSKVVPCVHFRHIIDIVFWIVSSQWFQQWQCSSRMISEKRSLFPRNITCLWSIRLNIIKVLQ